MHKNGKEELRSTYRRRAWPPALFAMAFAMISATFPAKADIIIQFTLDDVVFDSGATAIGTFTLDESTKDTTAVDIVYFGFGDAKRGGQPSYLFDEGGSDTCAFESIARLGVAFSNSCGTTQSLGFEFSDPLGATADSLTSESSFRNEDTTDVVVSGQVQPAPTPTPEPPPLLILAGAISLLLLTRRMIRRPTASARLLSGA
jgi:hypothetical protein